jgi:hypothetical protein
MRLSVRSGPIQAYIDRVRSQKDPDDLTIVPALWEVSRPGHNWTNALEREQALDSLMSWVVYQTCITRKAFNGTVVMPPPASTVEFLTSDSPSASATVVTVGNDLKGASRVHVLDPPFTDVVDPVSCSASSVIAPATASTQTRKIGLLANVIATTVHDSIITDVRADDLAALGIIRGHTFRLTPDPVCNPNAFMDVAYSIYPFLEVRS